MTKALNISHDETHTDNGVGIQVACQQCDVLINIPELGEGEQATCISCGAVLAVRSSFGSGLSLACALASIVMLALAYVYPFLTLEANGLGHQLSLITLPETMYENGRPEIAASIVLLTLVFPMLLMLLNISVLIPFHFGLTAPRYATAVMRWSHHLAHWSMVDVFVIGVLASLTKIVSLADITLGVGFWSYMTFAVLALVSLWHFDRPPLWQWIEPHVHRGERSSGVTG
ncbi:paraquat-inducible protein A [Granulosicoccus antarcticus]|uniref:Paraquat-inducible protein A n=1 Tax=Granulosicoccus antarcticus IMCC3135 TaxID=1192854 RepID=A0A2Z2NXI3_9GAMM|nr:paraquat-inducible protein A [Granulosicoccus antarcticus]ASJ73540.1 Paraquat-inducible protein A [Granulosicoccus antarcticus IMCC3135]